MWTPRAAALSFLMLVTLAFTAGVSSFAGLIDGAIRTELSGDATFGVVNGHGATPSVFTLSLTATGTEGSILFTRPGGMRLAPGTYAITGRDDGSDDIRVLVMTGAADHPTGVFRGRSGTLRITSVTDNVIRGSYRVEATGFLAADPGAEDKAIRATGGFTARRD
ncbi:MAG TPA: hypothetical protein VMY76_05020 [Gemmatimonadales bacterium]|nr:hypothetical protein [Gemmatimonadales bacterium]